MEKEKEKTKRVPLEDRIWERNNDKLLIMKNSSSKLFYWTIFILNIFILFVAAFVIGREVKLEKFSVVIENVGVENIVFLLLMFVAIMILKSLPDYLKIFAKTRSRKFFTCYCANVINEFYDGVTINNKGIIHYAGHLVNGKIKPNLAIDAAYSKKFVGKISFLMYGLVFMLVGACVWLKYIPTWLYLIALIGFVYELTMFLFTIYFGKNKEDAMHIVSSFCKFLVKIKLIKDYEKVFYKIVDTFIIYNKTFKQRKLMIWIEIYSNIIIYFIKGLAIYLLCYSMNLIEGKMFFQIIFISVVLQGVLNMWPLPKGTLIFELLFYKLVSFYFLSGYIYWAILIYRVFDYVLYMFQYLVVSTVLFIKNKNKNSTMQS